MSEAALAGLDRAGRSDWWVRRGLGSGPAAFLAEVEAGPDGWVERTASALSRPHVGNPVRAARAVAGAMAREAELLAPPGRLEALIDLAGASEWAARVLSVQPGWLVGAVDGAAAEGQPPEGLLGSLRSQVRARVAGTEHDTASFEAALRDLRTEASLRIALRELRGADIRDTAAELAELASAALQAALDHHHPRLVAESGPLEPACRHLVLGLGKLGGGELNFSSDIDLVYVYESDEARAGALSSHQFHVRLFERVTNSLSRVTDRGRVFRVDIDLRPEGRTGPICNSLAGLERYYETWGRTWERAAWIKARPVAGDRSLYDEVARFVRPFVFRRIRDLSAVEELVAMKAQIDASRPKLRTKSSVPRDLKLGRGGIREIEFFAQAQQLLFGGHDAGLRSANTLDALRALEVAGRLSAREREVLADAYLFLRRLEHRVQLMDDRQTHTLPGGEVGAEVARTLGYPDLEALEEAVRQHTSGVSVRFEGLLGAVDEAPATSSEVQTLLGPDRDEPARLQVLERLGSGAPHTALANLESACRHPRSPLHPAATGAGARVGAQLLEACLASPDLDRALKHLPDLIRATLPHRAYLEPLERSELRKGVARLLGASDLLARILVSNPPLMTAVLYGGALPSVDQLRAGIHSRIEDLLTEQALVELRLIKQEEILRTAVAELAGDLAFTSTQLRLTHLAEELLDATLTLALREAYARFGEPEDPEAALVLLGGGTLGARELGYRSDVDLSALFVGEGETSGGTRSPVSLAELYTRVMQRTLSFLTLRLPQGDLYPVDMRLRPSGSQGALVTSLHNFERYHREGRAQLWERQALVRTRVVAGEPRLRARAATALERATYGRPFPAGGREAIRRMREKLGAAATRGRRGGRGVFHLKHGEGGLTGIEFLVQGLLLEHGPQREELRVPHTVTALERLAATSILPVEEAETLAGAHQRHRRTLDWLRVLHDEPLDVVDLGRRSLRALALVLGYQGDDAEARFAQRLERDRQAVEQGWRRYVVGG